MGKDANTSSESDRPVLVSQHHSGSGDNVLGDKIVLQAISPAEIKTSIRDILTSLRHRQPAQAKEKLETLKLTSNFNADAMGLLDIITILIDLADGNVQSDTYQRLNTYIGTATDDLCADIAISAKIRLDVKNENYTDARQRYISSDNPGIYTNEVFYEFIANEHEIEKTYKSRRLDLDEVELCGLIRGALRLKTHTLAIVIAEYLDGISSTVNSKVFVVLSTAGIVFSKLENRDYWCITSTLRYEILDLCDNLVTLLNICKGKDVRVINLSTSLFQFVYGEYKPLADACWNYILEIETKFPDVAVYIRHIYERRPDNRDGVLYKITKAQEDPSYRREIVSELTSSKEISTEDSTLLSNLADTNSIRRWISEGGSVSSDNKFEKEFSILELNALACDDNPKSIEDFRCLADKFINDHKTRLLNLNPPRLLHLADKLLDLELAPVACEFLKPHIPSSDVWASPIVCCYLNALLGSQQIMTLNSILAEIDQKDWNTYLWQIKSRLLDSQHNCDGAIVAMEKALDQDPLSPYSWSLLLHLHKKTCSDNILIEKLLDRIPSEVFFHPSDSGFFLLVEMSMIGDFKRAEEYLINWFIDDPDGCATPFTNVYVTIIFQGDRKAPPQLSSTTKRCSGGVRYSADGKTTTKLLVSDDVKQHQSLLSISSRLGTLLSKMSVDEIEQQGMLDIKLLEHLSPYAAAFSIASELRQAMNDGSDCFHSFKLPKDPEKMFKSLERKLLSSDKGRDALDSNPKIPLFIKGYHQNSLSPVQSALYHLTNKRSVKHPLPAFGEENPTQMVLDVYSVIYLALTGLIYGLVQSPTKTIITIETKHYLEDWLRDINREDYLTIGVFQGGGLWRHTADDMQKQTVQIQKAVNKIIDKSDVVHPKLVDLTPDVLRIESIVDSSVFSSTKLSIANDIPWLCIDETFAQLSKVFGYKTVNANQFFSLIGRSLQVGQKQQGLYLHVLAGLPFPLTYEDIIQLSKSKDDHAHYLLAELLKMYPNVFSDTDSAIRFLHLIFSSILINAYIDGEMPNGLRENHPSNNGYVERIFNVCCYISMQCKDGLKAEYKLGSFLASLFVTYQDIPSMNKLVRIMAIRFIAGHFMSFSAINNYIKKSLEG